MTTDDHEERMRRLEAAVSLVAESQAQAWDAIGTLAKSHATTAKEIQNLTARLDNLAQLVERFIRAQKNGRDGG